MNSLIVTSPFSRISIHPRSSNVGNWFCSTSATVIFLFLYKGWPLRSVILIGKSANLIQKIRHIFFNVIFIERFWVGRLSSVIYGWLVTVNFISVFDVWIRITRIIRWWRDRRFTRFVQVWWWIDQLKRRNFRFNLTAQTLFYKFSIIIRWSKRWFKLVIMLKLQLPLNLLWQTMTYSMLW